MDFMTDIMRWAYLSMYAYLCRSSQRGLVKPA